MADATGLVRPLGSLRAGDGEVAGGKGANLGELIAAGLPVPDGFVLTSEAYLRAARAAALDPADPDAAAAGLRAREVPREVAAAALAAYRALGGGRVAVRSSATMEDLPGTSFAGQQDSYLNVESEERLLDAIRACWASLWNERAVAYRRASGINEAGLALAVVVQRMVDTTASGVMFTADPITGRRGVTIIEAAPGLGDAVVSGSIDPDRYILEPRGDTLLECRTAGERPVLDDRQVRELARLGASAERMFGAPQDLEFAVDRDCRTWLVQSRPITTLYPLPAGVPAALDDPRVYLSVNVAQGYFEPLTPMGIQAFRLLAANLDAATGRQPADGRAGPRALVEAGSRLFFDLTPILRHGVGRGAILRLMSLGEARSAEVLGVLATDPRFAPRPGSLAGWLGALAGGLPPTATVRSTLRLLRRSSTTRDRYLRELDALARVPLPDPATTSADERVDAFERLFRTAPRLMPRLLGLVIAGQLSWGIARWLLGNRAREDELQRVVRSAPYNPTTEMNLALWRLSVEIRADPATRRALAEQSPDELAAAWRSGALPRPLQRGLSSFLERYGFRTVGEIDLGVPRWSEDPTHLLGAIANYARFDDAAAAPDVQFARGAAEAEAMVSELVSRAHGPRRWLLRLFLRRVRALVGTREQPKFHIVRLILGRGRALLLSVGRDLAAAGRLARGDDVFFLTLPELRAVLAGGVDPHALIAERRAAHARERTRRRIPRILLSDGTDAEIAYLPPAHGDLRGSPASPGRATAPARVIRTPTGARLEPGEILVAPSTDPGWTPLFLTAGGLVMEMGGMMSHGAVVAREYGIPAVVGVAGATDRIATGDRVTVDGSGGAVSVETA